MYRTRLRFRVSQRVLARTPAGFQGAITGLGQLMTSTNAMFLALKAGAIGPLLAVSLLNPAFSQDIQTKQYDDGGIYEGAFKDGKQHGKGTYISKEGQSRKGEWANGHKVRWVGPGSRNSQTPRSDDSK